MLHIENLNVKINLPPSGALQSAFVAALLGKLGAGGSAPDVCEGEPPRLGQIWLGQGGAYAGVRRGYGDMPDHHLIVAVDPLAIFREQSLGTYGADVKGATSDHDGKANTIALAEAGSELCKAALNVEIEGHKDFYLMSHGDAMHCWANVPELFEKVWHLTSTQYSALSAWGQDFLNGGTYTYDKKFQGVSRLVRRLPL